MGPQGPIGVFDSGVGGLSVLRHIRAALPSEDLLYFADSGCAPYGDKPEAVILARSLNIAGFLLERGAKALVVACNTATAAAIAPLRQRYPNLPLIGVEPALKPAARLTHSGTVGVLATSGTLASAKFEILHQRIAAETGIRFLLQPCPGLADQIEKGELGSAKTAALIERYVLPLLDGGADTLVLGCTHYPFVRPLMEDCLRRHGRQAVQMLDTGEPVTRQLITLLRQAGLQRAPGAAGSVEAFTSGRACELAAACANLLQWTPPQVQVREADPTDWKRRFAAECRVHPTIAEKAKSPVA
ncbi:MAG: glutamate racemase [Burkholderiaceae bacterium]